MKIDGWKMIHFLFVFCGLFSGAISVYHRVESNFIRTHNLQNEEKWCVNAWLKLLHMLHEVTEKNQKWEKVRVDVNGQSYYKDNVMQKHRENKRPKLLCVFHMNSVPSHGSNIFISLTFIHQEVIHVLIVLCLWAKISGPAWMARMIVPAAPVWEKGL